MGVVAWQFWGGRLRIWGLLCRSFEAGGRALSGNNDFARESWGPQQGGFGEGALQNNAGGLEGGSPPGEGQYACTVCAFPSYRFAGGF